MWGKEESDLRSAVYLSFLEESTKKMMRSTLYKHRESIAFNSIMLTSLSGLSINSFNTTKSEDGESDINEN